MTSWPLLVALVIAWLAVVMAFVCELLERRDRRRREREWREQELLEEAIGKAYKTYGNVTVLE